MSRLKKVNLFYLIMLINDKFSSIVEKETIVWKTVRDVIQFKSMAS